MVNRLLLIVGLNILDVITTVKGFEKGYRDLNQIINNVYQHWGIVGVLIYTTVLSVILVYLLGKIFGEDIAYISYMVLKSLCILNNIVVIL